MDMPYESPESFPAKIRRIIPGFDYSLIEEIDCSTHFPAEAGGEGGSAAPNWPAFLAAVSIATSYDFPPFPPVTDSSLHRTNYGGDLAGGEYPGVPIAETLNLEASFSSWVNFPASLSVIPTSPYADSLPPITDSSSHRTIYGGDLAGGEYPGAPIAEIPNPEASFSGWANFPASLSVIPTSPYADSLPPLESPTVISERRKPENDRKGGDGYKWKQYGKKAIKGKKKEIKDSEITKSYFKCTQPGCLVKKDVQFSESGQATQITYKGRHSHDPPQFRVSAHDYIIMEDQQERSAEAAPMEAKIVVQTWSVSDHPDDGYKWRKYGKKAVKGNLNPRSYYRCRNKECKVRKIVERCLIDPEEVVTTYLNGKHNHCVPAGRN